MDFSLKPQITKELILSRFSEEQIMEYYLQVPVKKGLFRSTLRKDRHPTCSFYRNKFGTLIFKDFATGQYLNAFTVVQTIYGCSFYKALKIIANDFNIVRDDSLQKNQGKINHNFIRLDKNHTCKIQVQTKDFTEKELNWWNQFGITLELLNKYNVFSCKYIFINDSIFAKYTSTCSIYGYYGGTCIENKEKIELWKIYFPEKKNYRFVNNWPARKVQGYDQLPEKAKLLIITKSMKDVMCFNSLNISAIAPCSENIFVSDHMLDSLKERFKYIVVFYDNDRAGMYNMSKIRRKHPELIYTYIPKKYKCKDISDFYKENGRVESLKLINKFIVWLRENHRN